MPECHLFTVCRNVALAVCEDSFQLCEETTLSGKMSIFSICEEIRHFHYSKCRISLVVLKFRHFRSLCGHMSQFHLNCHNVAYHLVPICRLSLCAEMSTFHLSQNVACHFVLKCRHFNVKPKRRISLCAEISHFHFVSRCHISFLAEMPPFLFMRKRHISLCDEMFHFSLCLLQRLLSHFAGFIRYAKVLHIVYCRSRV